MAQELQSLLTVPAGGQRSSLSFTVANDTGHDQVRHVEHRSISVGKGISQLTTLVHRSWRLWCHVRRDATREGELFEELAHTNLVLGNIWVVLGVGSFQVYLRDDGRPSMAGSRDVDHVDVSFTNNSIQMCINEVLTGRCTKVTK